MSKNIKLFKQIVLVILTISLSGVCALYSSGSGADLSYNTAFADDDEAFQAGKEEGLSAKDTSSTLESKIGEMGKLEVLVASVNITNLMEIGNDYSALYALKGSVVFTVDLSDIKVKMYSSDDNSKIVKIVVPSPETDFSINDEETRKIREKQEYHWFKFNEDGDAKDGYQAFFNSMSQIEVNLEENIANYDELYKLAKDTAKSQIETFISAMIITESGDEPDVEITIMP